MALSPEPVASIVGENAQELTSLPCEARVFTNSAISVGMSAMMQVLNVVSTLSFLILYNLEMDRS